MLSDSEEIDNPKGEAVHVTLRVCDSHCDEGGKLMGCISKICFQNFKCQYWSRIFYSFTSFIYCNIILLILYN